MIAKDNSKGMHFVFRVKRKHTDYPLHSLGILNSHTKN